MIGDKNKINLKKDVKKLIMFENKKISIIVPVYNNEKYIDKCVESVLCQTYENWELILINDGSTDNSLSMCEKYKKDCRVKVVSQENSGVSATRNKGIELATGEYVTFIDSDDFVSNDYCSLLFSFMSENVSMVVLGLQKLMSDGKLKKIRHRLKEGYYSFAELQDKIIDDGTLSGFTLHSTCSVLYRKELLINNSIFFNSEIKYNEDGLFNALYFLSAKEKAYIDYNITPYTYRENVLSATHTVDLTSEMYEKNRQMIKASIINIGGLFLSSDILSVQLKRRMVSLFLEEAIYGLKKKNVDYANFKSLIKKYNIKENISTVCFSDMKISKRVLVLLLKLKLYLFAYYLIKIK